LIRIIGIGSPFGDDGCGLAAARLLADEPPAGTEIVIADRPGAALIELLEGVEVTILVDAVRSGAPPGTIHDLDLRDLPGCSLRAVSSHELGVAEAMQLVTALGRPPVRGRFLGIEVGPSPGAPSGRTTLAVSEATAEVVRRARQWVSRLSSASSCSRGRGEDDDRI
jgi:hydrogenase maturation protease